MADGRCPRTKETVTLGISTLYLLGHDFEHVLKTLKRSPIKNWELFDDGIHSLDATRVGQLIKVSKGRGVSFSVHGPFCDLNLATLNSDLRPNVLGRMERSLRYSALLGARSWVLHPGTHGALSWVNRGEDWAINLNNMKRLCGLGRKHGIQVSIENISAGYAILGHVKDFLRLYREWSKAPGMTLDVGHSHLKQETEQYLEKLGGRIRHVHVHDNNRDFDTHLAVGAGTIRWRRFLASLVQAGFEGNIVVESVKGPFASYASVGKILRSLQ